MTKHLALYGANSGHLIAEQLFDLSTDRWDMENTLVNIALENGGIVQTVLLDGIEDGTYVFRSKW